MRNLVGGDFLYSPARILRSDQIECPSVSIVIWVSMVSMEQKKLFLLLFL